MIEEQIKYNKRRNKMIKFRAQRLDKTEKWVYGDLVTPVDASRPWMIKPPTTESIVPIAINPETLGMYWKQDKNNNPIYQGDTVQFNQFLFGNEIFEFPTQAKVGRNEDGFTLKIVQGTFMLYFNWDTDDNISLSVALFEGVNGEAFEVVGDVYGEKE